MQIVDAQVHIWERDHPGRPWNQEAAAGFVGFLASLGIEADLTPVTYADLLARMEKAGVDRTVLAPQVSLYGHDDSYVLEAAARHPDRFAVVGNPDPAAPDLAEQIATFAGQTGAVAVRAHLFTPEELELLAKGRLQRLFEAAGDNDLAVCIYPPHDVSVVGRVATEFPELRLVVDHLGLPPSILPGIGDPLERLPGVLALAEHDNVSVKLSSFEGLSKEGFPFADLWPHIHRVLEAFGAHRVMWGSDMTMPGHDYEESLRFVQETDELSPEQKEQILGGTLRRVFRWP